MSTAAQIKRIHTLKGRAGLKDHQYRDLVLVHGAASSKDLDEAAANRLIADLDRLAGATGRASAVTATGRFAGKLQALWIAGYDLGVIDDRSDRAMLAFVEAQTGVSHTRFLVDATIAASAIEGLKGWIAREAGLRWPSVADPRAAAKVVVDTITAKLLAAGDQEVGLRPYLFGARRGLPALPVDCTIRDLHALARLLGDRLRARRAGAARPAKAAPATRKRRTAA